MIALLGLLLVAYPADGLRLDIASPQQSVLVGEPFKLVVRWSATTDLRAVAVEEGNFPWQSLRLVVDGPNGRDEYQERSRDGTEAIRMPRRMKRGDQVVRTLVFYDGAYVSDGRRDFLFPAGGKYRVWAVYTGAARPIRSAYTNHATPPESNVIRVTARMPESTEDKTILTMIARDRLLLTTAGYTPPLKSGYVDNPYRLLLKQHAGSPYLTYARLGEFGRQMEPLDHVYHPETREPLYDSSLGDRVEFTARHHRELAAQILEDDTWGPFEEEALHLAYTFASRAGAKELEEQARSRLLEKYPDTRSAEDIRRREAGHAPKD